MTAFSFTSEQIEKLHDWKEWLDDPKTMAWTSISKHVIISIRAMLTKTGFREGNDLSELELSQMFKQMGRIVHNQRRTRDLYEKNGIVRFNTRLRNLHHGYEPIVKRMDDFCGLQGVGPENLSQFLCVLDPSLYPISTDKTLKLLKLSEEQIQAALGHSLEQYHIASESHYYPKTIEFLRNSVIYEEIRNITQVETYYHVNALLWKEWDKRKKKCPTD